MSSIATFIVSCLAWSLGLDPGTIADCRVSFEFKGSGPFEARLESGGHIKEVAIDDKTLDLDSESLYFKDIHSICNIANEMIPDGQGWHRMTMSIEDATSGSTLEFSCPEDTKTRRFSSMVVSKAEHEPGTLRILYWNIQNGMWADQHNNYDDFVSWVKAYDPDVCVWCEAGSIYKDMSRESAPKDQRYLPSGWGEIAARYGHEHWAIGGHRDDYPQVVTSRYPIETIMRLTDTDIPGAPIAHGAGMHRISVDGRDINIVTIHPWPLSHRKGVSADKAQESANNGEGHLYRAFEFQYVLSHTVNNPNNLDQKDWVFLGDMNTFDRADNWFYKFPEDSKALISQDIVKKSTNLIDLIGTKYKGEFISTFVNWTSRLDYVYVSPSLYPNVSKSLVLIDKWTTIRPSEHAKGFSYPSDHRPILVDFKLK